MELLKLVASRLAPGSEKHSTSEEVAGPAVCQTCYGSRMEVVQGKGARRCPTCCSTGDRAARLLAKMPPRYRGVTLAGLVPRPDCHPLQADVIKFMRANPTVSYYLCGRPDTGKTHFLWALYEAAVIAGRNVVATTLHDWIERNIALFRETERLASADFRLLDLQESTSPWSIFLDDVDKKKVTEYVADMTFQFVDTAYRHKHQLVVTSQLDPETQIDGRLSLIDHFAEADPRYGWGIARRLVNDETAVWRMF